MYDLLIIGSGPGGYVAAIRAGQYGLKVGVIEKDPYLGGVCLHVGCVPTKSLLYSAEIYEHFLHPEEHGISIQSLTLDWGRVQQRKQQIVDKHAKGVAFLFKKHKVETITGYGRLKGGGRIEVEGRDGKRELTAKSIILATGSEARMLPGLQPDAERILTNIEILKLPNIPKSLAIIGAGAVGVEFASIYRRFGSEVTILEMLPRVVPLEDEEISAELARSFRKQGIAMQTGARVEKVEKRADGVALEFLDSDGKAQKLAAETLLVAVGRKPNTESIGLENTAIKTDRGFIPVDPWMATAEPNIYAIGDIVAASPQLAHVASMEGLVAVGRIAGKPARPVNYRRIPGCTYCEPQIGSVGFTEAQAKAAGYDVKIGKFPMAANSKSSILGNHAGFVKVVADAKYGEILGVHIIGPSATELVAEAVAAMEAEATVETLMQTIHAHPTLSEAMGDAFNAVYGLSINA
ncbi:MAG TPA: dihydrolipoyl dehydrogenase [Bryobacterales bacterium]|nr:dihydrolipoyl dehydrogenase [Bryobacterales bacterium]